MRIVISQSQFDEVWNHLLPEEDQREHAAFMFAEFMEKPEYPNLLVHELLLVKEGSFVEQKQDYLELSDEIRLQVIKKAHNTGLALIELHSHPFPGKWAASFSLADMTGLSETVPNMLWRLPNRPYTAIVVAPTGFDALIWSEPGKADGIECLIVDQKKLTPTNYTIGELDERSRSS